MKKLYDDRVPIVLRGTLDVLEHNVVEANKLNVFPVHQIFTSDLGWCVQFKDSTGQLYTYVVDKYTRMWEVLHKSAMEYDIKDSYIGGALDIVFYKTSNGWIAKLMKGKVNPYEKLVMA